MNIIFNRFVEQLNDTPYWEWCAVVLALAYLFLAIKESIWCWPCAFLSTAIYTWLFFDVNLFMESFLNAYYLIMAIYGWNQWTGNKTKGKEDLLSSCNIIRWKLRTHFSIIFGLSAIVLVLGFLLSKLTTQDMAYLDSFTTVFALVTTYMVTQKVLENWIYWAVINLVSVYLFYSKGLVLTSVLASIYTFLAIFGWYKWLAEFSLHTSNKSHNTL